jgi:hypothetical protein
MKEIELKLQVPPGQHRAAIMAAKLPVAQSPQHLFKRTNLRLVHVVHHPFDDRRPAQQPTMSCVQPYRSARLQAQTSLDKTAVCDS